MASIYANSESTAESLGNIVTLLTGKVSDDNFKSNWNKGATPIYNPFNVKPNVVELEVPLTDHVTRFARIYIPDVDKFPNVSATIVLFHGYGEHSGRYITAADWLTQQGFRVCAMDHSFHGDNTNNIGYKILNRKRDTFEKFYDDATSYINLIREKFPKEGLFVFSHSQGGLIGFNAALRLQKGEEPHDLELAPIKGFIFSAPCFWIHGNDISSDPYGLFSSSLACCLNSIFPGAKLPGAPLKNLSRDKTIIEATRKDKRCFGDNVCALYISEFIEASRSTQPLLSEFKYPFIIFQGDKDVIVQPIGSTRFYDASSTPKTDKKFVAMPGCYHEILNDPEADRMKMLEEIHSWINSRL